MSTIPFNIATPYGIAMDNAGNLYVTANVPYVYKVTPQGTISTFSATPSSNATGSGLAFDTAGNLFESLPQDGRVIRISPDGKSATTVAIGLTDPGGLAFDDAGNLFVASGFGQRITRIAPTARNRCTPTRSLAGSAGSLSMPSKTSTPPTSPARLRS